MKIIIWVEDGWMWMDEGGKEKMDETEPIMSQHTHTNNRCG